MNYKQLPKISSKIYSNFIKIKNKEIKFRWDIINMTIINYIIYKIDDQSPNSNSK